MHKDFEAAKQAQSDEPVTFSIGKERFKVRNPVPILPILTLAKMGESEDDEDDMGTMVAFHDMLFGLLEPMDRKRFSKACDEAGMDAETLSEIVQWVIEVTTARPTKPLSSSDERLSPTLQSSRAEPSPLVERVS